MFINRKVILTSERAFIAARQVIHLENNCLCFQLAFVILPNKTIFETVRIMSIFTVQEMHLTGFVLLTKIKFKPSKNTYLAVLH